MEGSSPCDLDRITTGRSDWILENEDEDFFVGDTDVALVTESRRSAHIFHSLQDLREEENRLIDEAVECTGVSKEDAFLLLRQHGWDVAAFNECFFEDGAAMRRRAGVSEVDEPMAAPTEQLCGICFCETGVATLPCEQLPMKGAGGGGRAERHPTYCQDCWRQYLSHAVQDGRASLDLRCPAPGCNEAVRPEVFRRLLNASGVLERYERFVAESFVNDSGGRARWCPGERCGRAACEPPCESREVVCPCGTVWCFGCGTDAHLPVACDTVRKWEEKNRDEATDATWIKVNTKLCPKCVNPIEKNGGCMHMTCRKPGGCGHEFCWICLAPWQQHRSCNAIPSNQEEEEQRAWEKYDLMHYGHFYERYMAHHKAEQFAATDQLEGMEVVAAQLCARHNYSVNDVHFLAEAVRQIRSSRRFLKWTYAHGYFTKFGPQERKFFEFHQGQLEGTLERLCDIMENTSWDSYLDEDADTHRHFYDLRAQLISLTGVVREFFSKLREALSQDTLFQG
mmetsp:Transcript_108527/g.305904  ORF Transcript_108527/g.305904 Transcript_108527/m.305904 type:complete len:510 (-) Transcript_108527:96-1625(-)